MLILFEDVHKIDETLQQFLADAPNAYSQDEYQIATKLWDNLKNQNFDAMVQTCRMPLFSFLETELVKLIKRYAANPPAQPVFTPDSNPDMNPADMQKQALDALL